MHYFAYGSNMCAARLLARVATGKALGHARLGNHALYCDKRGADNSAKFTIAPLADSEVHGVLFQLEAAARPILDGFEGPGYVAQEVEVNIGNKPQPALTYLALPEYRDPGLLAFDWYLAFAHAGAQAYKLPDHWVAKLKDWPGQPDPITARAQLNRSILAGAQPPLEQQRHWPC
ncbi:MAG: gamma-glutamylcyclotransferase family protein [Nevskiales bacterium]